MTGVPGVGEGGQDDAGDSGSDFGSAFTSLGGESLDLRRLLHALAGIAG